MSANIFTESSSSAENIDLDRFRNLVKKYIDRHNYLASSFWAEKIVTLGGNQPADIHQLAQCYYYSKEYHTAAHLIKRHNLYVGVGKTSREGCDITKKGGNSKTQNPSCRLLAAKCLFDAEEFEEALKVLEFAHITPCRADELFLDAAEKEDLSQIESSTYLLKGFIHETMENRSLAADCFRTALQIDPLCYEAFHALTHHHMLSGQEEKELLSGLPLTNHCTEAEKAFVLSAYNTKINKYSGPLEPDLTSCMALSPSLDYVTAQAEKLYYQCEFSNCFELTQEVLSKDPYHTDCLPIHIACLVELRKANVLFQLSHDLVVHYPEKALSWFSVGCYYYLIGKNDSARRYLSKASALDKVFGPAWIAYGHSFAVENEHDQAMAAYFKAAQLMKGCHLPYLYIGMEYGLTNNPKCAEKFFKEALAIAPKDPFVLHELGIVAFNNQEYDTAEVYMRQAVTIVEEESITLVPEKWGTLLNNLGHVYRKLKKYSEALYFHQQALRVSPGVASTYTALGLIHSLLGDYAMSREALHKALSLHRDQTVAASLLKTVMEQLINQKPAFEGEEDVPSLDTSGDLGQLKDSRSFPNAPQTGKSQFESTSSGTPDVHTMDVTAGSPDKNPAESTELNVEDMIMDDDSP